MPIKTIGKYPPLFCIHGEPLKFAMHMKADRPVYGLNYAYHVFRREEMPTTLDDYVDLYIDDLRSIQPKGPYYICGYSAGGLIAYAMARKLLAAGEKIGDLTLVEPTFHFFGAQNVTGVVKQVLFAPLSIKKFISYLRKLPKYLWIKTQKNGRQAITKSYLRLNLRMPETLRMPGFLMKLKPIMRHYIYPPLDITANLIYVNMDEETMKRWQEHWSHLLNTPHIISIAGVRKHLDLMEEPALSKTINLLDQSVLGPQH
jgi:thioesterase domain-containing protein